MIRRPHSSGRRAATLGIFAMIAAGSTAVLFACATDETAAPGEAPGSQTVPVEDGGADGASAEDAAASDASCDDCEYFPEACAGDVLCSNGPFDPATPGGAFDPRTRINIVRGRSVDDVWVASSGGGIAHFDGASWARSDADSQETLTALWLSDSGELAFGKLDLLYSRGMAVADGGVSAGGWTPQRPTTIAASYKERAKTLQGVWAPPDAGWLWAATRPKFTYESDYGLWRLRSGADGGFEVDIGVNAPELNNPMTSIHGVSADVLWAVGDRGCAARITGAQGPTPSVEMFNTQTWNGLRGVWVASPSDAWAVGGSGTIRHFTGDPAFWDIVSDIPTTEHLNAVWGSSPSDVWAVGDRAVVLHFDGTRWSRVKIAGLGRRRPDLYTVWTGVAGHVWVGGHGVLLSLGGKP